MHLLASLKEPRWRLAAFLAVAAALNFGDRAAMSAVLSSVRTDLHLPDVSLALLGSAFLWSYAVGSPIAGVLCDRYSRRRIVVFSLATWSAVTALVGFAWDFNSLLFLRFALGVSECLFLPAAVAFIAENHPVATRARALSFLTIGTNCGMVLGGSFSGFMAEHFGWRSGFLVLGIGGIALALIAGKFLPPPPVRPETAPPKVASERGGFVAALKYLSRTPSYYVLLAESMLSGFGMWVFFTWLPLYFREAYQMNLAAAGFVGTFMLQVSVMLGALCGGWVSDRVAAPAPHRRMLLYGVFYIIAAPFLLLFLGKPAFAVVACGIGAFSFLRGLGQANDNPTQCEIVPSRFRSTGVGIMNAVATAAGGCGVYLAGFFKSSVGLESIFAGISGIFLLAGIILITGYRLFMRRDIARAQSA